MSVREDILRLLEERGGTFQAPDGNAGRLIAEITGHDYNNVSTALYRMAQTGVVGKKGGPRRVYEYRLLRPSKNMPVDTIPQDVVPSIPRNNGTSYDELAAALLRRVVAIESRHRRATEEAQASHRQLTSLKSELTSLKSKLKTLNDSVTYYKASTESLEKQLEERDIQQRKLQNELVECRNKAQNQARLVQSIGDRMDEDMKNELNRMMQERPTFSGNDDE